jgi:hypothetical protein
MSSMKERFIARIRANLESWRAGEIDLVTFNEWQRATWAGIHAAGREIEAGVFSAIFGSAPYKAIGLREDDESRTVQLRLAMATPPRLAAPRYRGELQRTNSGYPMLRVSLAEPACHPAEYRHVAALVYDLAANMERLSHQLEAHWTITPDADGGQVVIELAGEHEAKLADEFITHVMFYHQLI